MDTVADGEVFVAQRAKVYIVRVVSSGLWRAGEQVRSPVVLDEIDNHRAGGLDPGSGRFGDNGVDVGFGVRIFREQGCRAAAPEVYSEFMGSGAHRSVDQIWQTLFC